MPKKKTNTEDFQTMLKQYKPVHKMDDVEVIEHIQRMKKLAVNHKRSSGRFTINMEYRQVYMALDAAHQTIDETTGKIDQDKRIYSNTYLPIVAAAVDAATTDQFNYFFAKEEYFDIAPTEGSDYFRAFKIREHMKRQHRKMKLKLKVFELLQMSNCFDYAVSFMRWTYKPGYVVKEKTEKKDFKYGGITVPYRDVSVTEEWEEGAIDRPDLEIIPFFNCAHDPRAKNGFSDSRFFIDWRDESIEFLMEMVDAPDRIFGRYKNIDKVLANVHMNSAYAVDPLGTEGFDPVKRGQNYLDQGILRIDRFWTHHEIIEVAANEVIRRTPTSGMPLELWKRHRLFGELRGMGMIERLYRNQLDINAQINQHRDFGNLVVQGIGVIDGDLAAQENESITPYPGKWYVNNTSKDPAKMLYMYQPGVDISRGGVDELKMQIDMILELEAISESQMGRFGPSRTSAREISAVSSGRLGRAAAISQRQEEDDLIHIYEWQFKLEKLNLRTDERFLYVSGKTRTPLSVGPKDYQIMQKPEFIPMGTEYLENAPVRFNQLMTLLQLAMQFPQEANVKEIFTDAARMLAPKDFQRYVYGQKGRGYRLPPTVENQLLAQGQQVSVNSEDDDREHLMAHMALVNTPDFQLWPVTHKLNHRAHIQQHQQRMAAMSQMASAPGPRMQDESDSMRGIKGAEVA